MGECYDTWTCLGVAILVFSTEINYAMLSWISKTIIHFSVAFLHTKKIGSFFSDTECNLNLVYAINSSLSLVLQYVIQTIDAFPHAVITSVSSLSS